jgi:hypothetical protein
MVAQAHGQVAGVLAAYDVFVFGNIADIGGGRGHLLRAILEAVPTHGRALRSWNRPPSDGEFPTTDSKTRVLSPATTPWPSHARWLKLTIEAVASTLRRPPFLTYSCKGARHFLESGVSGEVALSGAFLASGVHFSENAVFTPPAPAACLCLILRWSFFYVVYD